MEEGKNGCGKMVGGICSNSDDGILDWDIAMVMIMLMIVIVIMMFVMVLIVMVVVVVTMRWW